MSLSWNSPPPARHRVPRGQERPPGSRREDDVGGVPEGHPGHLAQLQRRHHCQVPALNLQRRERTYVAMHVDVDEEIHEVPRARSGRPLPERDGSNELPAPAAAEQFLRHQSAPPQPLEVLRVLPAKELEPVRLRQRREPGAVFPEEAVHRRDPAALSAHAASHRPGVVDDRLPEYDPDHRPPHVPCHPRELVGQPEEASRARGTGRRSD